MKVNASGIGLIKFYEGFRSQAYLCPAGKPTIGYGMTFYPNGTPVTLQDKPITEQEASAFLVQLVDDFSNKVRKLIKVQLSDNQFSAVVSLAYNIGIGNFKSSTLLKKLNAKDITAVNEFSKWVYSSGKKLPGLVSRRQAEAMLFNKTF